MASIRRPLIVRDRWRSAPFRGEKTGTSHRLTSGNPLGRGAEGRVHLAGGRCVKILNEPLPPERAEAVSARRRLAGKVPGFAWPTEIVKDPATGDRVGFAMDVDPGENLENLMDARATGTIPALAKARIACEVARAAVAAHTNRGPRIVLGDVLKAGNLIVDGEKAAFVDAGGVGGQAHGGRLDGGARPLGRGARPETAPDREG